VRNYLLQNVSPGILVRTVGFTWHFDWHYIFRTFSCSCGSECLGVLSYKQKNPLGCQELCQAACACMSWVQHFTEIGTNWLKTSSVVLYVFYKLETEDGTEWHKGWCLLWDIISGISENYNLTMNQLVNLNNRECVPISVKCWTQDMQAQAAYKTTEEVFNQFRLIYKFDNVWPISVIYYDSFKELEATIVTTCISVLGHSHR
jgi:hypothetical protein